MFTRWIGEQPKYKYVSRAIHRHWDQLQTCAGSGERPVRLFELTLADRTRSRQCTPNRRTTSTNQNATNALHISPCSCQNSQTSYLLSSSPLSPPTTASSPDGSANRAVSAKPTAHRHSWEKRKTSPEHLPITYTKKFLPNNSDSAGSYSLHSGSGWRTPDKHACMYPMCMCK